MIDIVEEMEKMYLESQPKIPQLICLDDLNQYWLTDEVQKNQLVFDTLDENKIYQNHFGTKFYRGKAQDKKELLLLSQEFVEELQETIFKEFNLRLPPVAYSNSYEGVKIVIFDSDTQIQGVKSEIKKYNTKQLKRAEAKARCDQSLILAKAVVSGQRPEPIPNRMARNYNPYRRQPGNSIYLFAIDVESFERNHDKILEIGWVVFDVANARFYNRHIIITEYHHVRNYKFVPDNKDNFEFGKSEFLTEKEAIDLLQNEFDYFSPNLALVCHGLNSELNYFQKLGITLRHTYAFDTNEIYQSAAGVDGRSISLKNLLAKYEIENRYLHNAGNDAHYTMLAFLAICRNGKPPN